MGSGKARAGIASQQAVLPLQPQKEVTAGSYLPHACEHTCHLSAALSLLKGTANSQPVPKDVPLK